MSDLFDRNVQRIAGNRALSEQPVTRRRFLGAAAVTAGGMLLAGASTRAADPIAAPSDFPSTDHFWYRLQPAGPYIDSQRDNKAFGFADGTIFLSEDNGRTWPHSIAFPDGRQHHVQLHSQEREHSLRHRLEAVPQHRQPEDLPADHGEGCRRRRLHPAHAARTRTIPAGTSIRSTAFTPGTSNGVEMLVWGNYCNVLGGAVPVNIYYSTDGGQTVKIAYAFGQNPHYRDNGSPGGGATGTLLGDPDNPVICRHIHCVAYNPAENAFYACTGDRERPEGHECHWLRGTYDANKDKWNWKVVVSEPSNSRYKSGGINFVDGKLYWVADANGPKPHDRGIFSLRPGRHRQSRGAHAAVQSRIRIGQHDHSGRRDSGVALCPRLALRHGVHHFAGHGPDLGAIRPEGVRQAIARPLQQEEQRRLVPRGLAIGMDRSRRGDVHQAEVSGTTATGRVSVKEESAGR